MDYAHPELLVEPQWVAEHSSDPGVRLIDCSPEPAYLRAHIPGAIHLPVHNHIKEPQPDGMNSRFVMSPDRLAVLMGGLGVSNDTRVVAYDDDMARASSRLWWVLNYYGHRNVAVLNGGWHSWVLEGRPVSFEPEEAGPVGFSAVPQPDLIADASHLMAHHRDAGRQVLDCRSDGEWTGTNSRGNKRSGRVPGARHLEWSRLVDGAGDRRFLAAERIADLLAGAGISPDLPTITYCQGGIRAAHVALALRLVGHEAVRVYDGSMAEWANRDDTPLEI